MPISLLVIACVGPMCAYSAPAISFDSVSQCARMAPMVAGKSRVELTDILWQPSQTTERTAFRCIDSATGTTLFSFDSADGPDITNR